MSVCKWNRQFNKSGVMRNWMSDQKFKKNLNWRKKADEKVKKVFYFCWESWGLVSNPIHSQKQVGVRVEQSA